MCSSRCTADAHQDAPLKVWGAEQRTPSKVRGTDQDAPVEDGVLSNAHHLGSEVLIRLALAETGDMGTYKGTPTPKLDWE